MQYTDLVKKLKNKLSEKRFLHSVAVSKAAVELAQLYGADTVKAQIAGLLHDYAKEIPNNLLLHQALTFGIVMDDIERHEPVLLHAKVGAVLVAVECQMYDPEITQAIRLHTTGGKNMSLLDKIIFLADFIEPSRSFTGVEDLRKLTAVDIDRAMLFAYNHTLKHIVDKNALLHPDTIAGRNSLLIERPNLCYK
ncbi:hypothetical protein P22_3597 [Propionispora sp. 2/2-37]|uniref:bis(5'-nucleosyl)-tetraphosphatase (symmetrical) YqeK n=1 Tax=Propionispora sp. 2/2-37 TaxID=1677858 RepID=UPI0006BB78BF|nr:bis(5'-nucleosyl)-tetraphosphatase (symmetrical) YqeK [Propionispora sp. 2/2-37]CUH97467.1 hypothetical protein P22_3597 [Propionispora sp. 2/2-37]